MLSPCKAAETKAGWQSARRRHPATLRTRGSLPILLPCALPSPPRALRHPAASRSGALPVSLDLGVGKLRRPSGRREPRQQTRSSGENIYRRWHRSSLRACVGDEQGGWRESPIARKSEPRHLPPKPLRLEPPRPVPSSTAVRTGRLETPGPYRSKPAGEVA